MYEPQFKSAETAQNKMASDQQKRLIQSLSARGYADARGGHMMTGQSDITQAQAMALDDLRNQYDSLINSTANSLFTGKSNLAAQKEAQKLANWQATTGALQRQYEADLGAWAQKSQIDSNLQAEREQAKWNLVATLLGYYNTDEED
jgi:hypothetical protein